MPVRAGAVKRSFDIHEAMRRIRDAVEPLPKAVLFELAKAGFESPFEILVACIITIRTREEVSWHCARRLFELAGTPAAMSQLSPEAIDEAIAACSFHEAKARQIHDIARHLVAAHNGTLPCDEGLIRSFRGVGPKCANLVLGIACHQPRIGVDIHVHRVTNRWGYVQAPTPEASMAALEALLPRKYWVEINRLLVPFGKHICTGRLPHCSTCPVLDMCQQVGVEAHR
ncbi:MAG TPA: endonuclease III [Alphaproteobacteria bacterium]|nr:endonuclease III [Alphaproteobacteria bacterium]